MYCQRPARTGDDSSPADAGALSLLGRAGYRAAMTDLAADLQAQIDALEEVGAASIALARALSEAEAARATDCPGWSVQDHLAHMVGLEQVLDGAPVPQVELPPFDHVVNDIDAYMERPVHARRGLPMVNIADEFAGMLPRRLDRLRALASEGDPDMAGPFGAPRPMSQGLPIRVFDLWTHEQDMRRAVGRPMRLDGVSGPIVAERVVSLLAGALPARAPDLDASLTFVVTGPSVAEATAVFGDGHGAAATIAADLGVIARLACGRGDVDDLLDAADLDGDAATIDVVKPLLALTP